MNNPGVNPPESQVAFTACIPCSGVYMQRALHPTTPGTKAEVVALAVAMGAPLGVGANYAKLQTGLFRVYGLASAHYEGTGFARAATRAAVAAGPCVIALAGDQFNLIPHYQSNHVTHSIVVLFENGFPGVQLDPLAPAGYMGDPFGEAELDAFAQACLIVTAPKPPVDPCAAQVKAATDPLNAKIISLNNDLAAADARINGIKKSVADA